MAGMIRIMKSFRILATAAALVGLQPFAFAATTESLIDDINVWQGVIDQDTKEQSMQDMDATFQNSKDLFPDLSTMGDVPTSVLDEKRQERTNEFVSIKVGSATITLADVPRDEWYAPYVRAIAERGLVSGYRDAAGNPTGRFGPGDNVTIEQMAKVMVSAAGISPTDCSIPTLNVTASGSWSAPYFSCAEAKMWSVYGDGSVDAHRNATRAEVVATLLQVYSINGDTGSGAVFTDVTPTLQYGQVIAKAKLDGIISGYTDINGEPTGMFGPNDPVTRAEFAKIVTLGMQVYGSATTAQ